MGLTGISLLNAVSSPYLPPNQGTLMLETCLKRGEMFEGFASDTTRTISSIGFGADSSYAAFSLTVLFLLKGDGESHAH